MTIVITAEATAVAVISAPLSIFAVERIDGFTARIYAMAANVVRPAINSRGTEVWSSLSEKKRSSMPAIRRVRVRSPQFRASRRVKKETRVFDALTIEIR